MRFLFKAVASLLGSDLCYYQQATKLKPTHFLEFYLEHIMDKLPFAVVYGAWIAAFAVGIASLVGLLYDRLRLRARLHNPVLINEWSPHVKGPTLRGALKSMILASLGMLILLSAAGEIAYQRFSNTTAFDDPEYRAGLAEILKGSHLAAINPLRRRATLEKLRDRLSYAGRPDIPVGDALVAVDRLGGHCADALSTLLARAEFKRVFEVAEADGCHSEKERKLVSAAALALGNFQRASDAVTDVSEKDAIYTHILAGRYSRAANGAEQEARRYLLRDGWFKADASAQRFRARLSVGYACLATALRAQAKQGDMLKELRKKAEIYNECRLLLADRLQGQERRALLLPWPQADAEAPSGVKDLKDVAQTLFIEGASLKDQEYSTTLFDVTRRMESDSRYASHAPWHFDLQADGIGHAILQTLNKRRDLSAFEAKFRDALQLQHALNQGYLGRYTTARQMLATVNNPEGSSVAVLTALWAGDLVAARRAYTQQDHEISPRIKDTLLDIEGKRDPTSQHFSLLSASAIGSALRGEGSALTDRLRRHHFQPGIQKELRMYAPWLPSPILARYIRGRRISYFLKWPTHPTATAQSLADMAHIASSATQQALALQSFNAARRIYDSALQRRNAVFLAVLDAL